MRILEASVHLTKYRVASCFLDKRAISVLIAKYL